MPKIAPLPKHHILQTDEVLAGGVVSSVQAGTLTNAKDNTTIHHVVVKQTSSKAVGGPQFSHTDQKVLLAKAPQTHKLDIDILLLLQHDAYIRVPEVHYSNKRHKLTVMTDFRKHGFRLMQDLLVDNQLPLESAAAYGESLGILQQRFTQESFLRLKPAENALDQMRERLQEIHVLSYDDLDRYRALEAKLLTDDGLIYTDGHPKNIAVNEHGEVMLFDFGRSIHGSLQFPAPNFAAHIGLAMLSNCIPADFGLQYIRDFIAAYQKQQTIEERWFVAFFVAEVLHRGLAMRWIDKRMAAHIHPAELKVATYLLYLRTLCNENPVVTIDSLLAEVDRLAHTVATGKLGNIVL